MKELEELATIAVDCGFQVHKHLGPGLLENVYELVLHEALRGRGLSVVRQQIVPIEFKGVIIDHAFKADIIVEGRLLIELKSTEHNSAVYGKQVLTYLRLLQMPLGLLMNFGMSSFKEGVRRIANDYYRAGD